MDKELFKQMFSEYCQNEVNAGRCDDGDCQWCAVNMAWDKIFCTEEDYLYYVVEFLENDGSTYSIAIKTTHHPSKDEVEEFLKKDMLFFGYAQVYNFYEVDEEEVYVGYDTDNIDNWPVLGN